MAAEDYSSTVARIWGVKNERVKFYGLDKDDGRSPFWEGASTLKDHNSRDIKFSDEKSIEVEAISFSNFLTDKLKQYSIVVIKMDIEGGEYDIIADLLEKKLFDNIDTMYLEFHSQYMRRPILEAYRRKEAYFRAEISKSKCSLSIWH